MQSATDEAWLASSSSGLDARQCIQGRGFCLGSDRKSVEEGGDKANGILISYLSDSGDVRPFSRVHPPGLMLGREGGTRSRHLGGVVLTFCLRMVLEASCCPDFKVYLWAAVVMWYYQIPHSLFYLLLFFDALGCTVLSCIVFRSIMLYCDILYCYVVIYCILTCIVLPFIALFAVYCIVMHCIQTLEDPPVRSWFHCLWWVYLETTLYALQYHYYCH